MRSIFSAAVAAALVFAAPAHALERVSALHSDIRISASGELSVTETIEVQASGREAQRGIVREFADEYRDRAGERVKVPLALESVLRNGRPEPYALERVANGTRLATGAPEHALARGKHVYQIVYRTSRQVGFLDSHDELHWNVGGGWPFAFERLSAEVSFERAVPAEAMKLEAATGAPGARGQDYHAFVREGSAAFRVTRPLAAHEGMLITVAFPKGVIAPPSEIERGAWYLATHRGVPVGLAVLALMAAFLFACRWRYARRAAAAPSATPPEGVGPGGVRYIARRRYDERCLTAALIGLQSRGYLTIRAHGERLRIERTGADVELFPGEEALARRLLRDARADIRRNGRALEEAGRRFARDLRQAFARRAWTEHGAFLLTALGVGLTGVLAMVALGTPPEATALISGAMAALLVLFAAKLLPLWTRRGRAHEGEIDALRRHLALGEPQNEAERARLLPYAVALDFDWAASLELSAKAPEKAPEQPRRPLRHMRSAAA